MDIQTALAEYGLDEKEIKIYLALLKHGKISAYDLSRHTGILRQTTYDSLNKLQQKGLVSQIIENKKTYFFIENPNSLIKSLKQKEKAIQDILPELNSLMNISTKSTVARQYKGINGIKLIYEDFLESKTIIKTIHPDMPEKVLKEYFIANFSIKRIEKKIPILVLKQKIESEFQKNIKSEKSKFREIRLSKELININTHITLYDNKIAFINYDSEPTGIIIEDKFIKESQENLFDILWKDSKVF
jgi:sugar-specific transcriptional regulator TrmB